MIDSSTILNIWAGAIYQETDIDRIDALVTDDDFHFMEQAARCYLVKYDNDIWSWRLFSSFPPEYGLGKSLFTGLMKEDTPNYNNRYFNDAEVENPKNWNTALTLVDIQNQPPPVFFKNYEGQTEKSSHLFIYRETFDNICTVFRGGLTLINSMSGIAPQWLNIFNTHAPRVIDRLKLFIPLPSDLSEDDLKNEAIPNISQFLGTKEMAEHLGYAVRKKFNGSINAHININAKMMGGKFLVSEEKARQMIEDWIETTDFDAFENDEKIGMKFLTEVIAEIID